jgi:F-type H+-transporting ATPase subunit c
MEADSFKYLAIGILSFGMLGAALGVGNIFAALLNAIARNPSAEKQLTKNAFVGAAMAEAMGLIAFVLAIMLLKG